MAKKKVDTVTEARRKFVQARVSATGRSDAASKAQFRARFDELSKNKEGRQKIAKKTGVTGVRKALANKNRNVDRGPSSPYAPTDAAAITAAWKETVSQPGFKVQTRPLLSSLNITPEIQASVDANIGNMDPRFSGYVPTTTTTVPSRMSNSQWYYDMGGSPEDYSIRKAAEDKKKKGK